MARKKVSNDMNNKDLAIRIWFYVGLMLLIYLGYQFLSFLMPALMPFIYAVAVIYILKPIVDKLESFRIPRFLALFISYIVLIAAIAILIVFLLPAIVEQVKEFIQEFPGFMENISEQVYRLEAAAGRIEIPEWGRTFIKQAFESIGKWGGQLAEKIPQAGINIASGFINLIFGLFISFYLLKDWKSIRDNIFEFMNSRGREDLIYLFRKANEVIAGFVRGQLIVAATVGILTAIALEILGVKYAFLLGLLTGILDLIPYFGPVIGGLLAILVAFLKSPITALWVLIIMIIIQQLEGMVIAPHIMKSQVKIHPAIVVMAMFIGGVTFGFVGLLLAIPTAAFLKAVFYEVFKIETGV